MSEIDDMLDKFEERKNSETEENKKKLEQRDKLVKELHEVFNNLLFPILDPIAETMAQKGYKCEVDHGRGGIYPSAKLLFEPNKKGPIPNESKLNFFYDGGDFVRVTTDVSIPNHDNLISRENLNISDFNKENIDMKVNYFFKLVFENN